MNEEAAAEEEPRGAEASLDDRDMGPEMDLANRPNPWLPAYGFQIQHHHANFQPAPTVHEDLRANGSLTLPALLSHLFLVYSFDLVVSTSPLQYYK